MTDRQMIKEIMDSYDKQINEIGDLGKWYFVRPKEISPAQNTACINHIESVKKKKEYMQIIADMIDEIEADKRKFDKKEVATIALKNFFQELHNDYKNNLFMLQVIVDVYILMLASTPGLIVQDLHKFIMDQ